MRKQGVVYMQQYVHLKLRFLGGILAVQDVPRKEVSQLIHKSAYELLEQQVQFNSGNEFPRELLALEGREFVFTVNKPETSKHYTPSTFYTDIPAIGHHFSNSTETTLSLVNDVFEESNNSISASTESTSTPTKKRASTLGIEDCVPQLSSKKLKGDVSLLAEEDGQLSLTKSKLKVGHVNDVFEKSSNSISASTESTSTPTKKRASTLGIEDCVPQLSSKKLKGDVSFLAEEDGQLSSTKSKLKVGHVTKDDCKTFIYKAEKSSKSNSKKGEKTDDLSFLVNDVFEESSNSISASTESTSTPTKKRASTLGIEDCVPQLSSKKLKGDVSFLAEEDGQLSSTKSKLKFGHVTKDDCAKPSSTKQRKAANLIPKKEKN
ncbi:hypothetical protein F2Q68_00009054 [Brassica cretica]|uniref:Uncharacterized protein n=1 Tax=Brassica cretica TaxID=69181 RepID=A0A8S9KXP7_BRACR|nr:hypothetical protein F2Q68_00009054 [Brassica cretica]